MAKAQMTLVISPSVDRRAFLQASVIEAGRQVLARLLLEERRRPAALQRLSPETHEALQTLRDAAAAVEDAGRVLPQMDGSAW